VVMEQYSVEGVRAVDPASQAYPMRDDYLLMSDYLTFPLSPRVYQTNGQLIGRLMSTTRQTTAWMPSPSNGSTRHAIFGMPANQSGNLQPM
jgi:hypothetical protein